MTDLPRILNFRMPAEATPAGFRQQPARVLLEVDRLTRRFEGAAEAAVSRVGFSVGEGEFVALLGPSGCGKTTTLRMIAGFEPPDAGSVRLRGADITALPPERRRIGFVFQDNALFPNLTVAGNVGFGVRRLGRAAADRRVAEMLDLVGLSGLGGRMPHELSGGQQQRVALARTLAPAPPLVLLDEPFSNLDAALRAETRQDVRKLLKAAGSAAILVTHDQEEALGTADRVGVMHEGRLEQIGAPDELYHNPVSAFVASFIGRSNILAGTANGMDAETPFGRLPLSRAANGAVRLAVRPEQILLDPDPTAEAVVIGREFRGHDQLFWVQEGGRCLLVISGPGPQVSVGARVRLRICDCVVPLS